MRNKKRTAVILAILLITVSLISALASCGKKPSSDEVLSAFSELYERSLAVNEYVYGGGIESDTEWDGKSSPQYEAVSEKAPCKTRAELEAAVLSVYSEDLYNDSIVYGLFSGYTETDDISPRYSELNGVLKVDISNKGKELSGRFDVSSAKIVELSHSKAVIRAPYTKGESTKEYELTMVMTASGWRFDTYTW